MEPRLVIKSSICASGVTLPDTYAAEIVGSEVVITTDSETITIPVVNPTA